MRYALGVEYDGRSFCGFQSQPGGCGVQDALERALGSIAQATIGVVAAGRTDAGVHATLQVVHFDTQAQRPLTAWVRGVNAALPGTVSVLWAREVDAEFHARFSATARHYTYLLLARGERPGLNAGRIGWYHRPLDIAAMQRAANRLLGEHDFSSFRSSECQAKSPVKNLAVARVTSAGELLRFDFSANAFLHHMIRNIVGALVAVGAGAHDDAWIDDVMRARDRRVAPPTFAADGLYFTGADYDTRFGLPATRRDLLLPG